MERLVNVRISGDPLYSVMLELTHPKEDITTGKVSVVLTNREAHELERCLHYFFSDVSLRSVTGDPNVASAGGAA